MPTITEMAAEIVLRQTKEHRYGPEEVRRALAETREALLAMCSRDVRTPVVSVASELGLLDSPAQMKNSERRNRPCLDPAKFNVQRFSEYMLKHYQLVRERLEAFILQNMGMQCKTQYELRMDKWPFALDITFWVPGTYAGREYVEEKFCTAVKWTHEERQALENFFKGIALLASVNFRAIGNSNYRHLCGVLIRRMVPKEYGSFFDK
jgi:hypothetical protein